MRHVWMAWDRDAPCSCGHGLRACPVYGAAVPRALDHAGFADAAAARRAGDACFKAAARVRDWSDQGARDALAAAHAPYLAAVRHLVADVAAQTGARCLVDSSKSPEMALVFDCLDGVDMYLVHLQRDPRAVACSWHRKTGSTRRTLRNIRIWARRQARLEGWARALGARYHALHYESFAVAPRSTIAGLMSWAELPAAGAVFTDENHARISWDRQHLFPPANEGVLAARQGDVAIRPAEAWKAPRNRALHWLALAGTWPRARRYFHAARSAD